MRLLLISSSNVHGYGYLDHAEPEIRRVLEGVRTVAFVPFALQNVDAYTDKVRERLGRMGFDVAQVRGREILSSRGLLCHAVGRSRFARDRLRVRIAH